MMMKNFLRSVVVLGALGAVCLAGPQFAEARGSGAIAGSPQIGSQANCFNETWGGVWNVCSSARNFVLPAIYDNAGNMTFQVKARGVSGTSRRVSCRAYSVNWAGGSARFSSTRATVQHTGATENLSLSLNAHGWGSTYALCTMDASTTIRNYHY